MKKKLIVSLDNVEDITQDIKLVSNELDYNQIIFDVTNFSNDEILSIIEHYKKINFNKEKIKCDNNTLKKILILDDDVLAIELIKDIILLHKKKNVLIDCCTDIDIFLIDMYRKIENVDLLLLDINFGFNKENGIDILKKIREYEINKGVSYWDDDRIITTKKSLNIIIMTSSLELEKNKITYQYGARFINKMFISQSYVRTMLNMLMS